MKADALDLEVFWRRLSGIADEVAAALVRTSFSMIVRDAHDYSCAICDSCGDMLVQASHGNPSHIGALHSTLKNVLKVYPGASLRPGDVLVTNDPWIGNGHTPDFFVMTPVFTGGNLANVWPPPNDRARLEQLCRYLLHPPLAQDRVRPRADGRGLVALKTAWRDGPSPLLFEPSECMAEMACVGPRRPTINEARPRDAEHRNSGEARLPLGTDADARE